MPKAPVHQTTDLQSLEFGAVEPLRNIVSDDAVSRAKKIPSTPLLKNF